MKNNLNILTFGYGNRKNYSELEQYFQEYNIKYLIDVRKTPRAWSRKWYGKQLSEFCKSQGIQYISKPCLGNISGNQHWISPDSNQATTDLLEISQLAKSQPVLLLCAEMDWHKCHRVEVAEKLGEMTNLAIGHLT